VLIAIVGLEAPDFEEPDRRVEHRRVELFDVVSVSSHPVARGQALTGGGDRIVSEAKGVQPGIGI
jgi:hypothetical protein